MSVNVTIQPKKTGTFSSGQARVAYSFVAGDDVETRVRAHSPVRRPPAACARAVTGHASHGRHSALATTNADW